MRDLFWLSDHAWAALKPHLPHNQRPSTIGIRAGPEGESGNAYSPRLPLPGQSPRSLRSTVQT